METNLKAIDERLEETEKLHNTTDGIDEEYFFMVVKKEDMSHYKNGDVLLIKKSDIKTNDLIITKDYKVERYKNQDAIGKIIKECSTSEYDCTECWSKEIK